jgi:tRNA modification GTPase
MLSHPTDAIVAVATATGRGAVGIVRISGTDLTALIPALLGCQLQARRATYLPFSDEAGHVIDRGLAIFFPAPHSYTGEDVLELQAHGGPVVLQLLLARCLRAGGAMGLRLAEPGEFTQRAFLNDKLDLAQAEAVADLIEANTEAAARCASRSLSGEFSKEIHRLRDALIRLRLLVESTLDFPEEEIDFLQKDDAAGQLQGLLLALNSALQRTQQGALLREGMTVVLAGQPNVGKSSLLNALAGAERAIVTAVPGTTRDKVTETIQIQGVPVHIVDTAGLRDTADEVEQIGVARTWQAIAAADAVLFLHDMTRLHEPSFQRDDEVISARLPQAVHQSKRLLHVLTKLDAVSPLMARGTAWREPLELSALTGQGLEQLRARLLQLAGWHAIPEGLFSARKRHVQALQRCQQHLSAGQLILEQSGHIALDVLAEELRLAQQQLSVLTGEFSADDLLGEIFSRFCIGK